MTPEQLALLEALESQPLPRWAAKYFKPDDSAKFAELVTLGLVEETHGKAGDFYSRSFRGKMYLQAERQRTAEPAPEPNNYIHLHVTPSSSTVVTAPEPPTSAPVAAVANAVELTATEKRVLIAYRDNKYSKYSRQTLNRLLDRGLLRVSELFDQGDLGYTVTDAGRAALGGGS